MKNGDQKREFGLRQIDLPAFLRELAEAVEAQAATSEGPVDGDLEALLQGYKKIRLGIKRKADRVSVKLKIKKPDLAKINSVTAAVGEAVFKPLYSTKARGMQVIRAGRDAKAKITAFRRDNRVMYIQQKIDLPGKDLGIVFLGGEYLTTYARCADDNAWNTTTRSGGRYAAFDPDPDTIVLAQRAQAPFDLDFTCVDVAETASGPIVFEVSAFGGFKGIATARGIDAAARYADYVIERVSFA